MHTRCVLQRNRSLEPAVSGRQARNRRLEPAGPAGRHAPSPHGAKPQGAEPTATHTATRKPPVVA